MGLVRDGFSDAVISGSLGTFECKLQRMEEERSCALLSAGSHRPIRSWIRLSLVQIFVC